MMTGFIFDLDGVLTDTAQLHFEAWQALGEKLGISIDQTFNEQLKGISRMDSLEKILKRGGQASDFTSEEKEQLAAEKNAHYVRLLEQLSPADLLPGVQDFLKAASAEKIPCSLASASKNAPIILEKLAIAHFFDAVVDPTTLTKGKPDPEIFLKAAEALGFEVHEVIGFEDAQAGIDGLKAAGIFAVGIDPRDKLKDVDRLVGSFEELSVDALVEELDQ
ncbi:beta-phosphoglucomutase [Enterococcus sp. 669A]|uniref:Beta-phosphoglucomutase n=1 Tax=Candidatus Enterococcus moelleringii TaxID=2815325 RepID=A0ABS3L7W4_9ENTE|nr:beta-phosphoglucomutase [Enterococcus sp. 669A]MBO1305702.1 beta-phosphoglucomutase [Enterococcus sp. 669A]